MSTELSATPEELRRQFLNLKRPQDIAPMLEIEYTQLVYYLYVLDSSKRYTTFAISKRSGGSRDISAPHPGLKIIQRKLNQVLRAVYEPKAPAHGYVQGKNIVTNAGMHTRKRFILNIDLKDFFPSIVFKRVRGLFMAVPYNLEPSVATVLAQICCHSSLPQGAPTSPIISNMICAKMDSQLRKLAVRNRCVYTRYADDISFSTSLRNFPEALAKTNHESNPSLTVLGDDLKKIIKDNGFRINNEKVRLLNTTRRQEVTGLTTNKFPNVQRKKISQVRAMLHAWDKYGYDKAEEEFLRKYDTKYRSPIKPPPSFRLVVRGRIEFIGMVRGKSDGVYLDLLQQFARLAPELVKKLPSDIEKKKEFPILLQKALHRNFNDGELKELCFHLSVDYGDIPGSNLSEKSIELVKYMQRHDLLMELANEVIAKRPKLSEEINSARPHFL